MNKLCIGLLFATAIAWAGIGVVNFPYGEKSGGPDACLAIQLNVQGVSPASGTVSIGEITAKWETEGLSEWTCFVSGTGYPQFDGEYFIGEDSTDEQKYFYTANEMYDSCYVEFLIEDGDTEGEKKFSSRGSYMTGDIPGYEGGWNYVSTNLTESVDTIVFVIEGLYGFAGATITNVFRRNHIVVPHATTNALFTVTAAGGNATNNLPDKTFLRFAGHDFVRYGTATGGVVNLFVED